MWDGVDRRKFPRVDYPCLITVRKNTPPQQAILTHTGDISVVGIRVIINDKIELMSVVDLEIDLKDAQPAIHIHGRVNRIKELSAGGSGKPLRYDTGIQIIDIGEAQRRRIQNVIRHLLKKKDNF
ncbi:MAG: PilZ domain-containing protein [Candidatus Omnitrophica bacterium]|nr:PilZ domain-containing protein [Candidatus Omnitrophota bacterium]